MKYIIGFLIIVWPLFGQGQNYTKRLALVIGNSAYQHGGALPNPVNDAESMALALQNLGFEVMKYTNVTETQMKQAINGFGQKLRNFDVGLFYYAGHGIQHKGSNYMIPVEADLQTQEQIEFDCVAADRVVAFMDAAEVKVNVIIMDACRNNPFERSWHRSAAGDGLAMMNAPSGTLIAYATSPGHTADDGTGSHGLYTSALLNYLNNSSLTIEQVFKKVRTEVSEKSSGAQVPWEVTSLTGDDFYFATNLKAGTITHNESLSSDNSSSVSRGAKVNNNISTENRQKADELLKKGHEDYTEHPLEAIKSYSKAIEFNPYFDKAFYWRASTLYSMKKYAEAIPDYSKAIEINPNFEEAYYYRALTRYNLKQYQETIPDFDKALEINPDVASMYYWRGQAKYHLENYYESITDINKSIELNAKDGFAYQTRANSFYMLKDYKAAKVDYTKAINILKDPSEVYSWRGVCNYNLESYADAKADFLKSIESNKDDYYSFLMLGHISFVAKDDLQAIDNYSRAITIKSDYKEALYWRGNSLVNLGRKSEALKDINAALQLDPTNTTYQDFKKKNF